MPGTLAGPADAVRQLTDVVSPVRVRPRVCQHHRPMADDTTTDGRTPTRRPTSSRAWACSSRRCPYIREFAGRDDRDQVRRRGDDDPRAEGLLRARRRAAEAGRDEPGGRPRRRARTSPATRTASGLEVRFVQGLRVTDAPTMELVKMVLVGKINKEIVAQLHVAGRARRGPRRRRRRADRGREGAAPDADLGFVGQVASIDPWVLESLADFVPVVASVGVDADGQSYNINADTVAGRLAAALGARKVIFLTDVDGIFRDVADPASLISECRLRDLRGLIESGAVGAGMIPKLGRGGRRARGRRGGRPHRRRPGAPLGADRDLHRDRHRDQGDRVIDEMLVQREAAALMPTYRRQPVAFVRGEGAALFDADGPPLRGLHGRHLDEQRRPLPPGRRARRSPSRPARLINVSNLYYTEPMIALAEWIRDRSLGGRVFFCNSGAEASEAALKLARKRGGPGRTEVVALVDGFHGRTYGALSLTGQPSKQEPFRAAGARRDATWSATTSRRSSAAVGPPPARSCSRWSRARWASSRCPTRCSSSPATLADRHGALLIIDEIQTGLSRTGPLFAHQDVGVVPDVMCLAKSLGGGVPIGAIVARPEFDAVLQPGDHGSTFAASPLACAAALAVLRRARRRHAPGRRCAARARPCWPASRAW